MNCFSCPSGTLANAAGLFNLEAIWLTSLFEATPSLTVIFRACRMALLIVSAISTAGFLWLAVRSKYPSSIEVRSTSGVKS
jgi:hypothetical protein